MQAWEYCRLYESQTIRGRLLRADCASIAGDGVLQDSDATIVGDLWKGPGYGPTTRTDSKELDRELARLGDAGWELTAQIPGDDRLNLIFKRPAG